MTRFFPWLAFACAAMVGACTSNEGGRAGNAELNVIVPNNGGQSPGPDGSSQPGAIDIQVLEYTIACNDGSDNGPFLDNGASFDDDVTLNGVLEVLDSAHPGVSNQDFGPDLDEVFVWQGFMDLPPTAGCTVQLRARDNDGEVICSATESFDVTADDITKINVLLYCGISFQAPVGMLDLDADFSFNVGNFCPELFILNALDSAPVANATEVQVRGRDGDNGCFVTCDPQTCTVGPTGLTCTPATDPGLSITLTTTSGVFDCDQDSVVDGTSCVLLGDQLDMGNVSFICDGGAPPGTTVTITALITDGDLDCDKTKQIQITCGNGPGVCGDGWVNTGEACDGDGAGTPGETATCDADCTIAICGDGTQNVTAGEICDDGNTVGGDGCPANCGPATCGDGVIDGGETCDDGNTSNGDGCASTCVVENGYTCTGSPSSCSTTCGDGVVAGAEACDDGNTTPGDGCDAVCVVETGYTCTGSPSTCSTTCGDGIIAGSEACDDGNVSGGDGCSAVCVVELGWVCTGEPSACNTVCGDNITAGSETCDDGNTVGGDGCSAVCQLEGCGNFVVDIGEDCDEGGVESATCDADCSTPLCGDGNVNSFAGEACDDNNTLNGDGCSSVCAVETGYGCVGEPSNCSTTCGDGIVAGAEACDDGGTSSGDGCSATCAVETGYGCVGSPSSCSPVCGDGLILGGEGCDDGNASSGDGCSSVCQVETGFGCTGQPSSCDTVCGDNLTVGSEQCDDGNITNGDGCRGDCTLEGVCGDGIVDGGEGCDDGNTTSGDGCNSSCQPDSGCVGENACRTHNKSLFGSRCNSWTVCVPSGGGWYQISSQAGGTTLGDVRIVGNGSLVRNGVPTGQTYRSDVGFLAAGNHTLEVCDSTGAGIGAITGCIFPEMTMSGPGVQSGSITDPSDGDNVNLAGPISGKDDCYRVEVPASDNYQLTVSNNSGGAIMSAGLYVASPANGNLVSGSATPNATVFTSQSGGVVTLGPGTHHVCVDVASLGSNGSYTVTLDTP